MNRSVKALLVLLATALLLLTAACSKKAPTAQTTVPTTTVPVTTAVDLRDREDYEALLLYIQEHPEQNVLYDVTLGDQDYDPDVTELTFSAQEVPYDDLLANLKYLPNVTRISLPETELTLQQLSDLAAAYPNVALEYTVSLGETVVDGTVTELDLSWLSPEAVPSVAKQLGLLPQLQEVQLMPVTGTCALGLTDVKALQDACPNVFFHYSFEFFGKTLSTADEVVEYEDVPIGDENEALIRQAMDILTSCTYFKLDDCGVTSPVMASLRDDYPHMKVVWRIHVKRCNMLTDEKILRVTHRLDDTNMHEMQYLTEATHLDIGHNPKLTDISFVQYMPNLECVILAGSNVSDISYFANCKKLIWLEMCYCSPLSDLSVLADHPTLKYLNVSFTSVRDFSALENVALERFNCLGNNIPLSDQEAFIQQHPDCLTVFKGKQPFGYGWRYNDYGYTYFEYYANMRIIFRYDDPEYFGNHKGYNPD